MKIETLELLRKLQEKFGVKGRPSGSFGKIVQKLLALTFHELSFRDIVERSVQGADIDATDPYNNKFTFEVKTTEGLTIYLSPDNVNALRERIKDGYSPIIAILRLSPFENWILAKIPINEIPTGQVLIESLERYRLEELETRLPSVFDKIVERHYFGTLKKGETYLKEQLKKAGVILKED